MHPTAAALLPTWLRAVWVVLLAAVVAVLALQAARTPAPARWWHTAYAVMGLGMIVMYAFNPMDTPGWDVSALLVLVVALIGVVALVVATVLQRRRGGKAPASWVIAVVDMVTLAYIQIPADVRPVIICVLFACYLAVQVVLRVMVAVRAIRGAPQRASRTLVDPGGLIDPRGRAEPGGQPAGEGTAPGQSRAEVIVPLALTVLALSMIYMLSV